MNCCNDFCQCTQGHGCPVRAHTPGPWRVAPASLYPSGINVDSASVNKYVCLVAGDFNNEAGQADARLIAAAPELLQALQYLRDCIERGHEPAMRDVNAAIAKAKGLAP